MHLLSVRVTSIVTALMVASASAPSTQAAQNPITAAREAFRKAQEEAKRKAQEDAQRKQGQPPVPSTSAGTGTPETTAKLAASLGFVDVAGLKLGMAVTDVQGVLKSINAKLDVRPTTEVVWPIDRNNTAAPPPQNAPRSVTAIVAESVAPGQGSESINLQAAAHPNPAVIIEVERTVNYDESKGPNFDVIRDGLRKKYGPESATPVEMTTNANKAVQMKWFFDEQGQLLTGNVAKQIAQTCVPHPGTPPGLCSTLTIIEANLQASGSGVVRMLRVVLGNNPLVKSANEAKQAYLRQVEADRVRQQQIESSQRATPKL